jgi:hypothetical protein
LNFSQGFNQALKGSVLLKHGIQQKLI